MQRVIVLLAIGLSYNYAVACTCGMIKKVSVEALVTSDLVFKGKAIGIDTIYGEYNGKKYPDEIMVYLYGRHVGVRS